MKRLLPLMLLVGGTLAHADEITQMTVEANTRFALDLYAELAKEDPSQNLFFSPFSISSALAMTAEGARDTTALEMGQVLGFPDSMKTDQGDTPWTLTGFHEGMAELNARLNGTRSAEEVARIRASITKLETELAEIEIPIEKAKKEKQWQELRKLQDSQRDLAQEINSLRQMVDQYEASVANALWAEKTYPFRDDYFATISRFYSDEAVKSVDFRGNPVAVGDEINTWVEKETRDRIKDLIPKGALSPDTRLVLVNAIYFKGDWSVPFEDSQTRELDFTRADGTTVKHPIMHAQGMKETSYAAFNGDGTFFETPAMTQRGVETQTYPDDDGFAMLALPYKGGDLSMLVITPNDPTKLEMIEEKLDPETIGAWIGKLEKREVNVFLPRFKSETSYTLGDSQSPGALQNLGMERAFVDPRRPDGASFDGMSLAENPMNRLFISKVLHKAFVEVNEKGTEAAAATAVIAIRATSLPVSEPFTPTFKADRPFLYLIRDNVTGCILFLGRMNDPSVE